MKIVTIVGARPQFIKAAALSRAIDEHNAKHPRIVLEEVLIHTGQHYDRNMSQVFFDELDIRKPSYNLQIPGTTHGASTGAMLTEIEKALFEIKPDWVLVYGDTNSTLAGALAASKMHIQVAHVEAGLRSFNKRMPEEINRVMTDHVSDLLFCPTARAVNNLASENIISGVVLTGDIMLDVSLHYRQIANDKSNFLKVHKLQPKEYVLATIHRAENTDDPARLNEIVKGILAIADDIEVILPLHPRTKKLLERYEFVSLSNIQIVDPVSFLDMILLEENAKFIVTDSGGIQKEAYFFKVPCITLRDETEWVETLESGWNQLVGANAEKIYQASKNVSSDKSWPSLYGNGRASKAVLARLLESRL